MNISSGSILSEKIYVQLYDNEQRAVLSWEGEAIISIFDEVKEHKRFLPTTADRTALIGALRPERKEGRFDFSDIIVRGDPGRVVTLMVRFGIKYLPNFAGRLTNNEYVSPEGEYYFLIDIHLRPCRLGEILIPETQVCKLCEDSKKRIFPNYLFQIKHKEPNK